MALSAARNLVTSEPPIMQIRAHEMPHESGARRLRRPPPKSGALMPTDSELQRGLSGPLGELGPRPPRE
eukprot:3058524-Alexandrium_andersonii.AAC.1